MTAAAQSGGPLSVSSLAQLTLSLLAILALIFAIGWAVRRFKLSGPRGRGDIAVIDELAVGPRERVVLLKVGDHQVLIGIAAGSIVGLTPLATPVSLAAVPPPPVFADRLRDLMKRAGASA